ncbi:hypothetical protein [Clostridium sp. ZBS12]|uniref:hypothetical protein n=1 Tax=Clostridium sp. ZBS12 TaxID=2949972 RepID=UPI00338DCD89
MEADVVNLGKEIERLERQAALDLELSRPTSTAIKNNPNNSIGSDKTGRVSSEDAEIICMIFNDYINGMGCRLIAKKLIDISIKK